MACGFMGKTMPRAHNFTRKQRAEIALRAAGCCEKCGARLKVGEGEADHVLPVELGGESTVENGQWLCSPCHREKTTIDVRGMRKAERVRDTHIGAKIRSGGFPKRPRQTPATGPIRKWAAWRQEP